MRKLTLLKSLRFPKRSLATLNQPADVVRKYQDKLKRAAQECVLDKKFTI